MAVVIIREPEPPPKTYVLELNEAEALFLYDALRWTNPVDGLFEDDEDPVFPALSAALGSPWRESRGTWAVPA